MKKILVLTVALLLAVVGVFAQTKVDRQGSKSAKVIPGKKDSTSKKM